MKLTMKSNSRKASRATLAVLAVAVTSSMIVGCGGPSGNQATSDLEAIQAVMPNVTQEMIDAAEAEGTLMVYTGTWADSTKAVIAGFNKLFPSIDVKVFETTTTKVRIRFLAEQRQGTYTADIIADSTPEGLDEMNDEGFLMNYTVESDANFAAEDKESGYWYPLRRAMVGVAWNTDLVSDEEAADLTWASAADPKWKGKGGIDDIGTSGCVIACLVWYLWDHEYGEDFIAKVALNDPQIYESTQPAASALAAGDISVFFNASETGLTPLFDKGAPIKWKLPEPAVGQISGQGVVEKAPHPNAAKLFQEYTFSEEGYTIWQSYTGIPAWTGMAPQTKVSKEDWYQIPTEVFTIKDPSDPAAQIDRFNRVFSEAG